MKYSEFLTRTHFDLQEILAFSHGNLVEDPPSEFAKLPSPPMLMMDRVTRVERNGKKGVIHAEKDIRLDEWFFQCHFVGDPVQPGVLGMDAVWQLIGFYCALNGAKGSGRALSCGQVEFMGQIRPHNKLVQYEIEIRRFNAMPERGAAVAIGNAKVLVDGEHVYSFTDAKAGIFEGMAYTNYPFLSENAVGGAAKQG